VTGELRTHLKRQVDRAVRERLPDPQSACRGCGVPFADDDGNANYVSACRTCSERRCGRAKRKRERALEEAAA
jgi:hypothetical protein